jgi:hypothetical protein
MANAVGQERRLIMLTGSATVSNLTTNLVAMPSSGCGRRVDPAGHRGLDPPRHLIIVRRAMRQRLWTVPEPQA